MKRLIIFVVIAGIAFGTAQLYAQQTRVKHVGLLGFTPANEDRWTVDAKVDTGDELDADHYYFGDKEDIDLSIVRTDVDMLETLQNQGKDELLKQLHEGEAIANSLFGVPDTKILDSKVDKRAGYHVLNVHSTQELPSGVSEQIEKYYMVNGQNLQVTLRWKPSADKKAVELAKADLEDGNFNLRSYVR